MTDMNERRELKMEYNCSGGCYDETPRSFLTKKEKIEMLKQYKDSLEKETRGVAERIAELEED